MRVPRTVCFSQGWTVEVHADAPYIYLEWTPTGSMDPRLPDMTPEEARGFAAVLVEMAERVEHGKG